MLCAEFYFSSHNQTKMCLSFFFKEWKIRVCSINDDPEKSIKSKTFYIYTDKNNWKKIQYSLKSETKKYIVKVLSAKKKKSEKYKR